MPRVKAITTGSVPSFSDVILNIAESESMSTLTHQDTILAQFKRALPGKLLMYGDDTWLTLFPDTFDRADGTTSFFVSVSRLVQRGFAFATEFDLLGLYRSRQQCHPPYSHGARSGRLVRHGSPLSWFGPYWSQVRAEEVRIAERGKNGMRN